MKKLFFFIFVLLGLQGFAQVTDTTTYIYCDASCFSKVESSVASLGDVNIFLDFGGGEQYSPDKPMKHEKGFDLNFNSIVDLSNYMSEKKWILDKSYAFYFTKGVSSRVVTHLLFKKPKYSNK